MCVPALGAIFPALAGTAGTAGAATGAAATAGSAFGGLGSILQIGGGLLGAIGQFQNMRAQASAAEASAAAAQEAAGEALEAGKQESDLTRRRGAAALAESEVAMAANGMDVTQPQSLDLLDETQDLIGQDAFRIRTNSWREAKGLSQKAANYRAEAATARSASIFQPLQTVLTTGSKVAGRYASWEASRRYPGTPDRIMGGGY